MQGKCGALGWDRCLDASDNEVPSAWVFLTVFSHKAMAAVDSAHGEHLCSEPGQWTSGAQSLLSSWVPFSLPSLPSSLFPLSRLLGELFSSSHLEEAGQRQGEALLPKLLVLILTEAHAWSSYGGPMVLSPVWRPCRLLHCTDHIFRIYTIQLLPLTAGLLLCLVDRTNHAKKQKSPTPIRG